MSFGYRLVKLALKLKGEKRSWSISPVDYHKKRKQNMPIPNRWVLHGCSYTQKENGEHTITEIIPKHLNSKKHLIFYCHSGAFIYGPTRENWNFITQVSKQTGIASWMIDYPKAPEYTIDRIAENVYKAYKEACKTFLPEKIIVMGDSAGGNLILTLAQRLAQEQQQPPSVLVLVTPVIDASMSNPKIKEVDLKDPILSVEGILWAKKMCAGDIALTDPMISPIYGDLQNLPPMYMFSATDDILTPDQELFEDLVKKEGGQIKVFKGESLPHVWPTLPIMPEAKEAVRQIVTIIRSHSVE